VVQAAMKDSNESIGQRTQRLMVGLTSLAEPVVVVARAGGPGQGTKGPLVAGVGEPPVAGQASHGNR